MEHSPPFICVKEEHEQLVAISPGGAMGLDKLGANQLELVAFRIGRAIVDRQR